MSLPEIDINFTLPTRFYTSTEFLTKSLSGFSTEVAKTKIACQTDIIEACKWKLVCLCNAGSRDYRVMVRSSFALHLWKAVTDAAEEWV